MVLLAGIGGTLFLTGAFGKSNEVLLEAKAAPGPDPFTPTSTPPTPAPTQTPTPATVPQNNPLAIYGGTGSDQVCDKAKLVAFLQANPAQAAAWASVLGITAAQIPSFVAPLQPAVLRHDTRITNHGFAGGKATERQSVFQAGTSVLMDEKGVPVARCLCGNPLLPAKSVSGTPKYTGSPWPGFNSASVVASTSMPAVMERAAAAAASANPAASPSVGPTATPQGQSLGGPNLVVDGGFESGLVAPWGTGSYEPRSEIFWGSAQATAIVQSSDAHSGTRTLSITNGTAQAPQVYRTMAQAVAVTAGAQYCLSFWAKSLGAQAGILSFPLDHAWAHRIAVKAGTYNYTQYAGTLTAESSSFDVRLISENIGAILIDDIQMTAGACTVPAGQVPAGKNPRH